LIADLSNVKSSLSLKIVVNDQNKYLTANFVKQYDLFQYIQYSKIFSEEL